ncbi:rare lipoprotein A [Chromohalobacter marismortui]|uniref:Endolytic peptidoglycan transglycosylase RlpA n=1 Tax=Chromohalobacter marismortui TaxID=42055 RepID=A0A4R7NW55_9GAMM|nr:MULTISPECIES: septal ring lytic transglycosylase RlpA family protein [Chromohalobacter]MCI0510425.1 septal ring lytic transglycosylase RlpA family protein [Chromohalobacter sp.]MCI0594679.1 septal ring lytic transglycosylase RlpA family protein [Chromohalobacter sp.]TDU24999.1 rare lipoprotein A [Chromohalobacter marismortui]
MRVGGALACVLMLLMAGCASDRGGRYAQQRDAYPDTPPDVSQVPDAVPKVEPLAESGNGPTYEVWGKTYHVLREASDYQAEGKASWYGTKFQGYDTASGEPYDMYKMTAAHRTLPLPTYARVTNLDNGRDVIVRINDRGPFHGDRLIDLSYAAAARLKLLDAGTGRVRVEAIDPRQWAEQHKRTEPSPAKGGMARASSGAPVSGTAQRAEEKAPAAEAPRQGRVTERQGSMQYVQVAALSSVARAKALEKRLQASVSRPVRIRRKASLYRVQVGPVRDASQLDSIKAELQAAGFDQSFVVSATE